MNVKLSAAKTAVVLDHPFFGALVCNLKFHEDTSCDTAWTDGTSLGYNPQYIDSLSHAEIVGLLVHEVMHCAAGHPFRRDMRDGKKWNVACDKAINHVIREANITLPSGSLESTKDEAGKSSEWIYDRLPDMPDGGNGSGKGDSNAPGEVRDAPSPQSEDDTETMTDGQWQEITRNAATQAKMRGDLPSGLDRWAKLAAQPKVDWKSALRKFVQQTAKADYSWRMPSSRYAAMGIYLPSMQSEDMPRIAIGVDTSGSMDDVALAKAKAEVLSVIDETSPSAVDVLYADARVARHDTFERNESVEFRPAGGGGTDFRPVFAAVEAMEEPPACIIYITDLQGTFPSEAPSIPVLWVTDGGLKAPFGETIEM